VVEPWIPQFVALDLDGTVVDRSGAVSDVVRAALVKARERGCVIALATGRSWPETRTVFDRCPELAGCWVVCNDGALLYEPGAVSPRWASTVSVDAALSDLRREFADLVVVAEGPDGRYLCSQLLDANEFPGPQVLLTWDELRAVRTPRLFLRTGTGGIDQVRHVLDANGTYSFVVYSLSGHTWADLHAHGVSKATTLEMLRESVQVDKDLTLAIGDSWNDIDMLSWAQVGAATADAPPELLAVADIVVPACAQDGVAVLLDRYLL
jgi:hydroxymethylpyrimidine pyrophosphatase-like HAD family hydrolase